MAATEQWFAVCATCPIPSSGCAHPGAVDVPSEAGVTRVRAALASISCSECSQAAVDAASGMCFVCNAVKPLSVKTTCLECSQSALPLEGVTLFGAGRTCARCTAVPRAPPLGTAVRPQGCTCDASDLLCLLCYADALSERARGGHFMTERVAGQRTVHGCAQMRCDGVPFPSSLLPFLAADARAALSSGAGVGTARPLNDPSVDDAKAEEGSGWQCHACSASNAGGVAKCYVCATTRVAAPALVATTDGRTTVAHLSAPVVAVVAPDAPATPWSCPACTYANAAGTTKCTLCDTRAPASALAAPPLPPPAPVAPVAPTVADGSADPEPAMWACLTCATPNDSDKRTCRHCGTARLVSPSELEPAKEQPWKCPRCSFSNIASMSKCSACAQERPEEAKDAVDVPKAAAADDASWACEACTAHNEAAAERCHVCGCPNDSVADPRLAGPQPWNCPTCTAKNEATSRKCTVCERDRPPGLGDDVWHCGACTVVNVREAQRCGTCGMANPDNPPPTKDGRPTAKDLTDGKWVCERCTSLNEADAGGCVACMAPPPLVRMPSDMDPEFFVPPEEETRELELLTSEQRAAVDWVANESRKKTNEAKPRLLERMKGMGYQSRDMLKTLTYIRDRAPLICHIHLKKMATYLENDTHYRNQFETGTSHGLLNTSTRTKWEDRLFNNIYHSAKPFDRCKYGVLNMVLDPRGVKSCRQYGTSYLLLKGVRLRSSFADMDSGSPSATLATCEYYAHVLEKYNDRELKAVIDIATGAIEKHESGVISTYKEIQVHGELDFSRHVAACVVDPAHRGDRSIMDQVERAAKKHGFEVVFMDDLERGRADIGLGDPTSPVGVGGAGGASPAGRGGAARSVKKGKRKSKGGLRGLLGF